ncbi:MAG: O-antigen ligase family protein [Clostridia bacterium]|nr:O-antigen ligase family protein [Clostridia bacterium]
MNETLRIPEEPKGLKWKLFGICSKIDTQKVALLLLLLLNCQIFYGVFSVATTQSSLVALFYGKATVIRLIGFLGLLNWLVDIYCRVVVHGKAALRREFIRRVWVGILTWLLLWSFAAVFISLDTDLAFFGGAYRYEGFVSFVAYAGIFMCASQIRDEKYRKILLASVGIFSTVLAGLTLLRELAHATFLMNRGSMVGAFSGTFINSNHYGYYLCVSMLVLVGLFTHAQKWQAKVAWGLCFAINAVMMLYNQTLGAYFALLLGFVLYAILFIVRKGIKKAWPILALFALLILLSFVVNQHKMLDDIGYLVRETKEAGSAISSDSASSEEAQSVTDKLGSGRGKLWKKTIQVILEHPLMGVGTDNVQLYINYDIPHNEYLQIGANLGFPGLAAYLLALIVLFVFALKNTKNLSDCTLIAGVAVFVYCASAFTGISIPVATYQLFLYMGLLNGWFRQKDDEAMLREKQEELQKTADDASAPSDEQKEGGDSEPGQPLPEDGETEPVTESSAGPE